MENTEKSKNCIATKQGQNKIQQLTSRCFQQILSMRQALFIFSYRNIPQVVLKKTLKHMPCLLITKP